MTETGRPVMLATMLGLEGWDPVDQGLTPPPRAEVRPAQFRAPCHEDILPASDRFLELDAYSLGIQAVIYGCAPVALYMRMMEMAGDSTSPEFVGFHRFRHASAPTAEPNIVTSEAWLDLSEGPAVLTVPDMGGRYYTACFQDLFANASNIGPRTYGGGAGRFAILPPGWSGELPEEVTPFAVASRYLRLLLHLETESPEDALPLQALRSRFGLQPLQAYRGGVLRQATALPPSPSLVQPLPPLEFYRLLGEALRAGGVPERDRGLVAAFARFGLRPDRRFAPEELSPATRRGLVEAHDDALAMIDGSASQIFRSLGGWSTADLGMYGDNHLQRAVASRQQPDANVKEECLTFTAEADGEGVPLDGGKHSYLLRFAPGALPPVNGFWSLALAERSSGRPFAHALRGQTPGSRSEALALDADGGLEIRIQATAPANSRAANWLPAPTAPFCLVLRSYRPRPAMLEGDWHPPPVVPLPPSE